MAQSANKANQSVIVKTIGERMKAARELCNMSLSVAARRLGYVNPSKLSKVENATDTNSVPLLLIKNAANLYEVSIDYIFGASSEWDARDERSTQNRLIGSYLVEAIECTRQKELEILSTLYSRTEVLATAVLSLSASADDVEHALQRVEELNAESFQELRAGSRLVCAVDRCSAAARNANGQLKRFHLDLKLAKKPIPDNQLQFQLSDS